MWAEGCWWPRAQSGHPQGMALLRDCCYPGCHWSWKTPPSTLPRCYPVLPRCCRPCLTAALLPSPTSCFPALPRCCPAFKAPNATTLGKTSASLCPSSSYVSDMSDTVTSQAVGPGETCQLASGRQTGLIRTHSSHLPRARKVSKTPVDRNQGAYRSAWHNLQCWYWRRAWAQP